MPERMYALHLRGGGTDLVCDIDANDARRERTYEYVTFTPVDPGEGDACGWCGWTPKPHVEVTL